MAASKNIETFICVNKNFSSAVTKMADRLEVNRKLLKRCILLKNEQNLTANVYAVGGRKAF